MSQKNTGCFFTPAARFILFLFGLRGAIEFGAPGVIVFTILCAAIFFWQMRRKFWKEEKNDNGKTPL